MLNIWWKLKFCQFSLTPCLPTRPFFITKSNLRKLSIYFSFILVITFPHTSRWIYLKSKKFKEVKSKDREDRMATDVSVISWQIIKNKSFHWTWPHVILMRSVSTSQDRVIINKLINYDKGDYKFNHHQSASINCTFPTINKNLLTLLSLLICL